MHSDLSRLAVPLPRGEFVHLPAARGRRIECLRGSLWLTVENDRRDILLGAGEGFTLDADAPALLGAMADSNFIVLPGATPWAG